MGHSFRHRARPGADDAQGSAVSSSAATKSASPTTDAQNLVGNSGVSGLVAAQATTDHETGFLGAAQAELTGPEADRLSRLNDRALRPGDARDSWTNTRERDRDDFIADTRYAPDQLPKDPESVLAAENPDWGLFLQACSNVPQARRQAALQVVRREERWDEMIQHLGPEHTVDVQAWLAEDVGDSTEKSVEDRVAESANSDRARRALAAVRGFQGRDPGGRLTERFAELLALGVGMPANERDPIGKEGILSLRTVNRACEAILAMPLPEYLRLGMLLELSGDSSRLRQSFLLLEATAARKDEASGEKGSIEELEGFSDAIRGMNDTEVVEATTTAQTGRRDKTSLQHKFVAGEGAGAAQLVAAEADPLKALAMNQEAGLGRDALDTATAKEQETMLERNSNGPAVARRASDVRAAVTKVLRMTSLGPIQRANVTAYLHGLPCDEAMFAQSVEPIRRSMGLSFPGEQAMRLARESATLKSQGGLGLNEVAAETQAGAGAATGETFEARTDMELVEAFEAADKEINRENMEAWAPRVEALLAQISGEVDGGLDVVVELRHDGGGSSLVTITNVDGGRFLVHDTTGGATRWVDQSAILRGDWSAAGQGKALLTSSVS